MVAHNRQSLVSLKKRHGIDLSAKRMGLHNLAASRQTTSLPICKARILRSEDIAIPRPLRVTEWLRISPRPRIPD